MICDIVSDDVEIKKVLIKTNKESNITSDDVQTNSFN